MGRFHIIVVLAAFAAFSMAVLSLGAVPLRAVPLGVQPAAAGSNFISGRLYPGVRDKQLNEINEIRFEGNKSFDGETLLSLLASQPTTRSIPHKILQAYYNEFKKNTSVPGEVTRALYGSIGSMADEIRYFNDKTAESDVMTLWHFYNTKGFHYAEIYYTFEPEEKQRKNILTFHINENSQYKLKAVEYTGLEAMPPELAEKYYAIRAFNKGKDYDESSILAEISQVHSLLLNNGFYHAYYNQPEVSMDTLKLTDSVTVHFSMGKRQRIGSITYVDSMKGQQVVVKEMKRRQLEFTSGDWYSRAKVERSKDNLLSLGTFDVVAIDTTHGPGSDDSTMNMKIFTQYRKQQEYGAGLFINQTPIDNFINLGFELSYFHRNIFGAAQVVNPFASIAMRDLSRIFSREKLEYEVQAGFKFAQPLLWTIDNSRVGLVSSFLYSQKTLINYFKIETFSFPVKFTVKFPNITYFNQASFDFSFERENPVNFSTAKKMAIDSAKTPEDIQKALEMFILYDNLDKYLHKGSALRILTSNLLGVTLTGDSRNHPFSPTRGNYTIISLDGWNFLFFPDWISGVARYYRFQMAHYQFVPLRQNIVLALKGRVGVLHLLEGENSYVPIDRQFFAGGANSVRGWPSRMLRYSKVSTDSTTAATTDFLKNYVGNAGLIEGSIELRYKFSRPVGFSESFAEQIANIGVTLFADFGNAFHWLMLTREQQLSLPEYVKNLALAAGFGFRYETPVGPIRLDIAWPVYDPLRERKPFSNRVIHIGLGHAF